MANPKKRQRGQLNQLGGVQIMGRRQISLSQRLFLQKPGLVGNKAGKKPMVTLGE